MDKEIKDFTTMAAKNHRERCFFVEQGLGAEVHWFFTQAAQALEHTLYLPACTSFLNGIEASLRVTMAQLENPTKVDTLHLSKTLSNELLKSAREAGLPVEALAFQRESDFLEKLESKKPDKVNAEIVRIRHNLCHGNILEYINTDLGADAHFFTPECCRELANCLYIISKRWTQRLGVFRQGLHNT